MIFYPIAVSVIYINIKIKSNSSSYIVSSVVKKQFEKLGAIHTHASSLHSDVKRSRPSKTPNVDLLDSDSDAPFTTSKTTKNKGKSIHEIIVKHEHQETPSSLSTTKSFPESVGSSSLQSNEIRMINDRIEVINDLLKTFVPEDPEFSEFTKQKRTLLMRKLKVLPSFENKELFFLPNK